MANKHAQDLRRRIDAASENLSRQIQGMDTHMERADAPGEWTTREVLSHLLFQPGFDPATTRAARENPAGGRPRQRRRREARRGGRLAVMAGTSGLVSPSVDVGARPVAHPAALPFRTELSLAPLIRFWTQLSAYSELGRGPL